jgi:Zn-dependent peptidase ImmA (M78 family)
MKFKINNEEWYIREVEQKEFWGYEKKEQDGGYYQGQTHFNKNEIWIDKDLPTDLKKKTLYHELMHCYINTHISTYEFNITEEILCDISAHSHDLIHKIVKDYFD